MVCRPDQAQRSSGKVSGSCRNCAALGPAYASGSPLNDNTVKGISALSDEALSSPSSLKNALTRLIRRKGLVNRSAAEALNVEWNRIVGPEIGRRSSARRIDLSTRSNVKPDATRLFWTRLSFAPFYGGSKDTVRSGAGGLTRQCRTIGGANHQSAME